MSESTVPPILQVGNFKLQEVLGTANTQYEVPFFQRGYAWERDHIVDLWQDILTSLGQKTHFLGSIVVNTESGRLQIVDGQQRLTTLTILLCVIRDLLAELELEDGNKLSAALHQSFIGDLLLDPSFRLKLSFRDDEFFQDYVQRIDEGRKSGDDYGLQKNRPASHQRLYEAYRFFRQQIEGQLEEIKADPEESLEWLKNLQQHVLTGLHFIKISVGSLRQAFVIFETLNDRGLALSVADLLKNYLFSRGVEANQQMDTDTAEQMPLVRRWDTMVDDLEDINITTFLRHYWLSRIDFVRTDELFDAFKEELADYNIRQLTDFVLGLYENATRYKVFFNPGTEEDPRTQRILRNIQTLRARQCFPLLLAGRAVYGETEDFTRLAWIAEVMTFRYSTIGNRENRELERVYHRASLNLANAVENPLGELLDVMPDDEEFYYDVSRWSMRWAKYPVQYMFRQFERDLNTEIDDVADTRAVNIEHIMPVTLSEEWTATLSSDDIDRHAEYVNRLGNLTILDYKLNAQASNSDYSAKLAEFEKSTLVLNKTLTQDFPTDWNIQTIEARQSWIADMAVRVWNVDRALEDL